MKQVHVKLLLSLLLATVATASYGSMGGGSGQSFGSPASGYQSASVAQPSYSAYQTPATPSYTPSSPPSYGGSSSYGSSSSGYGSSYAEPTGPPYGIQSTGEYSSYNYYPEKLDLSKCGSQPTENPCTAYGPQYFPLPGSPNCYIQCAFERMFVKPCPANLVWNARINVCDWPTVAYGGNSGSYGSSSYGGSYGSAAAPAASYGSSYGAASAPTASYGSSYGAASAPTSAYGSRGTKQQDASSYSYGRKKRATVERKKRQIFPVPPLPFGAPVFPFALPGPVGFPGPLGFPGLPGPIGFPTPFIFPFPYEDNYDYDYDYDDDYGSKKSYGKSYGKKSKYGKKYSSKKNSYDYGKKDYDSYNRKDYSNNYRDDNYDDDYYGKSRNYEYKRNGNFKDYRSYKKYDSYGDDSNYYRKRRDYGTNTPVETPSTYAPQAPNYVVLGKSKLPLSTLCASKTTKGNLPHPTDIKKYIACNDDNSQQIMDCPNDLVYNPMLDRCENIQNPESMCERENPCLNGGQCYQTSPSSFKCTCRESWTGERCESPVSACANNPCGEGNTCHTLKTGDFKQDFVCVCNGEQSYGLTCGANTVPNPCLNKINEEDQYHPFAFSAQAFIQCNGDIFHVQPCAAGSLWSQTRKICDRGDELESLQSQDQAQSFQLTSGSQQQSTYGPPTASFPDKTFFRPQGYSSVPSSPPISSYGQVSTYGSSANQMIPIPANPVVNAYGSNQGRANSKIITRLIPTSSYSSLMPQQFIQTPIKSSESRVAGSYGTAFSVPANPLPQQYAQRPIIASQPVVAYGSYATPMVPTPVPFNPPVPQYGQRPMIPSQPVASYGSYSAPTTTQAPFNPPVQQYGQRPMVPSQPVASYGSYSAPTPTPVPFNPPVQQYGQRPMVPSQPVASYGSYSAPTTTQAPFNPPVQQYGQQTEETFVAQQPTRVITRVLQPEISRNMNVPATGAAY